MIRRRLGGLLLTLALFAGCEREAAEKQKENALVVTTPTPNYPVWAQSLIGGKAKADPATTNACRSAFDVVKVRHRGPVSGVEVEGWSWLTAAKAPAAHVIFLDSKGVVVGAGETSVERPDVHAAIPDVSKTKVGWHGEIGAIAGAMTVLAALPDGSYCALGSKEIAS